MWVWIGLAHLACLAVVLELAWRAPTIEADGLMVPEAAKDDRAPALKGEIAGA